MAVPEFWLVAGPNGAGKTTLVQAGALPAHVRRLNPYDRTLQLLRQRGVPSFAAAAKAVLREANLQAAEEVFAELNDRLARNEPVGVETVLSTDKYQPVVESVGRRGGVFCLIYIALRSPALSQRRVAARFKLGGHDVPAEKLEQRWHRSIALLPWFAARASHFWVFDNSASDESKPPVLIASGGRGLLAMTDSTANPVVAQALLDSPLFTHKLRFN